ncbi:MAG: hypothetical protein KBT06_11120 [Prevotellaceae bacterium]|nr:hypothetical protein [Candidatus Colivivens equi]
MAHFVNPDGTIEFIDVKYDSAGNFTLVKPYKMSEVKVENDFQKASKKSHRRLTKKELRKLALENKEKKKEEDDDSFRKELVVIKESQRKSVKYISVLKDVEFENFTVERLPLRNRTDIQLFFEQVAEDGVLFTENDYQYLLSKIAPTEAYKKCLTDFYELYKANKD